MPAKHLTVDRAGFDPVDWEHAKARLLLGQPAMKRAEQWNGAMLKALRCLLRGSLAALVFSATAVAADRGPMPPCRPGDPAPEPAFAALGAPPAVSVWRSVALGAGDCFVELDGPMDLTVALSVRFRISGGIEEIATRAGAISHMIGMQYWSVTDGGWRELVSAAYAVSDPENRVRRGNFTAAEVLSGRTLYFVQDDSRSSGLNLYRLTARRVGVDGLAVEFVNMASIRYLLVPLFDPGALISLQVVRHLQGDEWGYYGLSAVRTGGGSSHERSWINRAAAYQRLLMDEPTDGASPLAR